MAARDLRLLHCSSSSAGKLRGVPNPPPPSIISKLGDGDLLLEVLIRAPDPRSAFRCKLVCKRWNSLISDPYFNRRFVSHHHQRMMNEGDPSLLIRSKDRESVILSFLPLPCHSYEWAFHVFDCFKDLVLCGLRARDPGLARTWFVCNPFTKQWVALPLMPERTKKERAGMIARLVCEPRSNPELDLGDGRVFVHSEYRFRVVCMYPVGVRSTKLDVFCSESGAWTEGALVLDGHLCTLDEPVVSCNGRLFCYALGASPTLAAAAPILGIDPFRLDRPPFRVDGHPWFVWEAFDILISQGVLHVARLDHDDDSAAPPLLTVWRQEEDDGHQHISWSKLYQVSLKEPSKSCNHSRGRCYIACLHPGDPEIVFLHNFFRGNRANILYHDVRTGEEGVFDDHSFLWRLFQPRISCWPTPIPNYEKLRAAYDGSYSCWVQQTSRQAAAPPALPLGI